MKEEHNLQIQKSEYSTFRRALVLTIHVHFFGYPRIFSLQRNKRTQKAQTVVPTRYPQFQYSLDILML